MIVYRVEMPDGLGPYYSEMNYPVNHRMGIRHEDRRHPTPVDDFGWVKETKNMYFGFDSPQKLFGWFGGWLKSIFQNGGKIVKYNVDQSHVHMGTSGFQLIFDMGYASKL